MNNFHEGDLVLVNGKKGRTTYSIPYVEAKYDTKLWYIKFFVSENSHEIGIIIDPDLCRWETAQGQESLEHSPTVKILLKDTIFNVPIERLQIINKYVK